MNVQNENVVTSKKSKSKDVVSDEEVDIKTKTSEEKVTKPRKTKAKEPVTDDEPVQVKEEKVTKPRKTKAKEDEPVQVKEDKVTKDEKVTKEDKVTKPRKTKAKDEVETNLKSSEPEAPKKNDTEDKKVTSKKSKVVPEDNSLETIIKEKKEHWIIVVKQLEKLKSDKEMLEKVSKQMIEELKELMDKHCGINKNNGFNSVKPALKTTFRFSKKSDSDSESNSESDSDESDIRPIKGPIKMDSDDDIPRFTKKTGLDSDSDDEPVKPKTKRGRKVVSDSDSE